MFVRSTIRFWTSAAFGLALTGLLGVNAQTQPMMATPVAANAADLSTSESGKTEPAKPETSKTTAKPETDPAALTRENEAAPAGTAKPDRNGVTDRWQFQLTPYLWLASLHGATGSETRQAQLDASFGDIFSTLKFAFMGTFEARKNKLGLVTDLQYVSLSDDKATPGPLFSGVEADVKTFIFDPEVAYRVYDDPEKGASIDLMGGMRIVHVSTDLKFLPGILLGQQVDASRTWVDAVAGMRFRAHLSSKVFVLGKFDLGGGGSKFTFQLFGGLGYEINPKIALMFGYRDLDIDYRRDNFVYDTSQRGPIAGVAFRF